MNPARVAIVMNPVSGINPQKDSSFALMLAAQERGANLFYLEMQDLFIEDSHACGRGCPIAVFDNSPEWYRLGQSDTYTLGAFDIILMRQDPPVDKAFLHAAAILAQAEKDGARVCNAASALLGLNEKILATYFPQFCPPTMVAAQMDILRGFYEKHGHIVLKPLDSMGGEGVFVFETGDVNFETACEVLTARGTYPVMAQKFIPAIRQGDKRIIVINGTPFDHVLTRIPKQGSLRGNMAAGGSTRVDPITDHDRKIATEIGQTLRQYGIVFAGLDMIGDFVTEINFTSPTGLRQISKACGQDVAGLVIDSLL